MGPSASGKTEVAKILDTKYHLKKVITHTTRRMRCGERQDIDYHFIDRSAFLFMKSQNEFVETTEYNGNYYGTSKKEIADDKCVILDPTGARSFYRLNDPHIFIVSLHCSEAIRIQRMRHRKDEEKKIESRIRLDRSAFSEKETVFASVFLSSETDDPEVLAEKIFFLYRNHIR